jgi:exopolysaccharide production protein ExoY
MLTTLGLAILAIVGAALSRLLTDDIRAWVPRLVELIIARAIKNLPVDKRDRYYEEWLNDVSEVPGDLSKLVYSLGLLPASWSMRQMDGRKARGVTASADMITGAFDVIVAALLLILSSPIFIVVAVAISASEGPIFFGHRRIGYEGQPFYCLKFRTVAVISDPLRSDPHVTRIGKILRETSLDELPQLINVLLRQMSLVGPRPIVESEVHFYGDDIAHYYNTRPGVTGLWQVSGRSNTSYAERVKLDTHYAQNRSMGLYLSILLRTLLKVFGRNR